MNTSIVKIITLSIVMTFALQGTVFAQSLCKGLDKKTCKSSDKCSWVKGYTKNDGKKVTSHCKTKVKSSGKKVM